MRQRVAQMPVVASEMPPEPGHCAKGIGPSVHLSTGAGGGPPALLTANTGQ